ncbi:30S ribosome-binding factor [Buchnera aphidicola (Takecallis arundicolens)]|uniref:30S ribosome-binding factor RbfA n=1 Tax=Buchnera aphidicola TaxID=9 RepID=UPI003464A0E7
MKLLYKNYQKKSYRYIRISQELKKAISNILQNQFRDPRISSFITVSMVKLSRDLSCAKVFISYIDKTNVLNNKVSVENKKDNVLCILKKASGYIRSILCKILQLRKIPILIFYNDDSFAKGMKITNLLKTI